MHEIRAKILIVDDDSSIRNMLAIILAKEGYDTVVAENGQAAMMKLKEFPVDLVITDMKMPDINGIELLTRIKAIQNDIPVIMITAFASTNDAVEAMKLGADDYITKPFNLDELKLILRKSLSHKDMERENIDLKSRLEDKQEYEHIIGRHQSMLKIFDLIDSIAQTDSTALIVGESGTGKELIAKAIHRKSLRSQKAFISINCGALPETLLESELFGHVKGSFTDAYRDKPGLFEVADHGTLFLDEIGEMSQTMQVKLLRAIQERKIRRIGGDREIEVDVRIISATNKDLQKGILDGNFRKDLFYRLNVITLHLPPLRDRREDIPLLMHYFLDDLNQRFHKSIKGFKQNVMDMFNQYDWPGNVRELENFIERAIALEKSDYITLQSLPEEMMYSISGCQDSSQDIDGLLRNPQFSFEEYLDGLSKQIILRALQINNSHIKKTAEQLKLNYRSLRHLMEKYQLRQKQ